MYFIIKIQFIKQNISKISNSMKELLKSFNIDFDNLFKNSCIGACQAMSNSIKFFFPDYNNHHVLFSHEGKYQKSGIKYNKVGIPYNFK